MQVYVKIITKDIKKNEEKVIRLHDANIKAVKVEFNSPDNSISKVDRIDNIIEIIGFLDDRTRYEAVELFNWARTKTNDMTAYRRAEIRIIHNSEGQNNILYRTIILPRAFVLDYFENFKENAPSENGDSSENAVFTLRIKQKVDELDKIEVSAEPLEYNLVGDKFEESTVDEESKEDK
jgi:hypothetical protein